MRKIAIINQKGGVGKTTTAVNLSAALARRGHRVCLADLDPQAHASLHLSSVLEPARLPDKSMYHVFVDDAALADIRQKAGDNLWVCAADIDLAAVELELAGVAGREIKLRRKMERDAQRDDGEFDHFIFDCPPSLGILTVNALAAVDEVYIPLQPHFLALHGVSKLLETIELVSKRINAKLKLGGVVLCLYETATKLAKEVDRDVQDFLEAARGQNRPWSDAHLFETRIRKNIRLAEAPSFGKSIFEYAPDSPGAFDYDALAEEYLASRAQREPISPAEFHRTMAAISEPVMTSKT
jgi:chromosome partitioning protein